MNTANQATVSVADVQAKARGWTRCPPPETNGYGI